MQLTPSKVHCTDEKGNMSLKCPIIGEQDNQSTLFLTLSPRFGIIIGKDKRRGKK
jgi:hypothetical protein